MSRLNPLNRLAAALQGSPSGVINSPHRPGPATEPSRPPSPKAPTPRCGAGREFLKLSDKLLDLMVPPGTDKADLRRRFVDHLDALPSVNDWREHWSSFLKANVITPPAPPAQPVVQVAKTNPWRERMSRRIANQTGFVTALEKVLV